MSKDKKSTIGVQGTAITVLSHGGEFDTFRKESGLNAEFIRMGLP